MLILVIVSPLSCGCSLLYLAVYNNIVVSFFIRPPLVRVRSVFVASVHVVQLAS